MSAGSGHTHHTSHGAAVTEEHVGVGAESHDDDRVSEATSRRSVSPPVTGTLAGDAWELSIKLQASQGCKPAKASVYRRQDGKLVFKKADGTEVVKEDEEKDEDEWAASAESAAAAAAAAPPTRYARSHSHSNLGSRGASSQAGERATGTTTPRMRGDAPASTGPGHDWACAECSYLNWSRKRRSACHKCGTKKPGGGGAGGGSASAAAAADAGVASEAPQHQPLSRAGSRKARRPAAGADAAAAEEGAGEAGAAKETGGGNPTPEKKQRPPLAVAAMGVMGVAAMPRKNAKKTPAMGGMGVFGGGGGGGTKKRGMAMGMGMGMGMGAMSNVGAMGPSGEGRGGARGDAAEKAPATPPRTPQSTPGDDPPTPGSSTATSVSSANPSFFCRQIAMINDVLSHTTVRAAAKQQPPHPMPTDIDPTQAGSYPLASKRGGQGGKKGGGGKGAEGGQRAGHKRDTSQRPHRTKREKKFLRKTEQNHKLTWDELQVDFETSVGAGAYGKVFKCWRKKIDHAPRAGDLNALKLMHINEQGCKEELLNMSLAAESELKAWARITETLVTTIFKKKDMLGFNHIVTPYKPFIDESTSNFYLLMEFMHFGSLDDLMLCLARVPRNLMDETVDSLSKEDSLTKRMHQFFPYVFRLFLSVTHTHTHIHRPEESPSGSTTGTPAPPSPHLITPSAAAATAEGSDPPAPTPLKENLLSYVLDNVLAGLHFLHSLDIVHQDVKPGNILINTWADVKIADFGLTGIGKEGVRGGTRLYMSPERLMGRMTESKTAADIWSVGVTALECALGLHSKSAFHLFTSTVTSSRMISRDFDPRQLDSTGFLSDATADDPRFKQLFSWEAVVALVKANPLLQPTFDGLSDQFKDFCLNCLEYSPEERPPASRLREHAFIAERKHVWGRTQVCCSLWNLFPYSLNTTTTTTPTQMKPFLDMLIRRLTMQENAAGRSAEDRKWVHQGWSFDEGGGPFSQSTQSTHSSSITTSSAHSHRKKKMWSGVGGFRTTYHHGHSHSHGHGHGRGRGVVLPTHAAPSPPPAALAAAAAAAAAAAQTKDSGEKEPRYGGRRQSHPAETQQQQQQQPPPSQEHPKPSRYSPGRNSDGAGDSATRGGKPPGHHSPTKQQQQQQQQQGPPAGNVSEGGGRGHKDPAANIVCGAGLAPTPARQLAFDD